MGGYIRIYRTLKDHWVWRNSKQLRCWLDLLLSVAWESGVFVSGKKKYTVERGQIVGSIRYFANRWNVARQTASTYLSSFESENMIKRKKIGNDTVVTIINYDKYQAKEPTNGDNLLNHILGQKEEYNKVKNNNSSNTHACEKNFFWDKLEATPIFIENCCMALKCDSAQVEQLLVDFKNEMRAAEHVHIDMSDCKHHFIRWSKTELQKINKDGAKQKTGNSTPEDKYSTRRGTDPGSLGKQDFNSDF